MAAYFSEENCGCGEASKLGSARKDLGLDSSIVVASSTAWLDSLLAWQDGEVATSVGVPAAKMSAAASSIARLEGGEERVGHALIVCLKPRGKQGVRPSQEVGNVSNLLSQSASQEFREEESQPSPLHRR